MAYARKLLAILIAAALSLAPVGSAMARFNGSNVGAAASAGAHGVAHGQDNRGAHAPVTIGSVQHSDASTPETARSGSGHCDHANASKQPSAPATDKDCDCCGDHQSACAEFCLQKCFGQLCVIPPDGLAGFSAIDRFRLPPAERPPDWAASPVTPPPRT